MNLKIFSVIAAVTFGMTNLNAISPSELKNAEFAHYTPEQLDSISTESFIKNTPLKQFYPVSQLRKIKNITFKAFDKKYELEGLSAYDSKINDLYTDVYTAVNTDAQLSSKYDTFMRYFKEPHKAKKEKICVSFVIELDGTVGPVYMTRTADKRNKEAIAKALRMLRYSKPATFNGQPVRSVSAFTLVID